MSPAARRPEVLIAELRDVLTGPLAEIAQRFSTYVDDLAPHSAMVIFTRECTGRPRKVAGDPSIVDRVTIAELDRVRNELAAGEIRRGSFRLAGRDREVCAILDSTDTLLVLVPRGARATSAALDLVRAAFGVVATGIRLQVHTASPAYLAESRAASAERARTVAELTESHAVTLETILATLRSKDLDDTRARTTARETATEALIGLRSAVDLHRELAEEALTTAFARLHGELRDLVRHRPLDLQMVAPPVGGRGLPGEVAHAARAIARGAVLAMSGQTDVTRVRVAWTCDDSTLLVDVRDDGNGEIDVVELGRQLRDRVETLGGGIESESTPGWGTRVAVSFPLDLPIAATDGPALDALAALAPREIEVLEHLVAGRRNRVIAERLGVSESTVKFHVAGVLRKLGVSTRGEAAALGAEAGVRAAG
ncbi:MULTISPECIES: LuxR C-terminal-related transcriptional regulator [Rhodococcus]|uniref:Response regulator containing a CheY-like receiver domain and an HTH DNA-binding domain n=1 Tax=Rhodococcus rhodochrous J45 TaxID=935266 RepID=A0A562DHL2_RHORH|nr:MULTISPECIES: LuxR C-terminal-related transcriptional regulator [Rhodococcus]OWY82676.1 helix-turn-helix transcriptional regulator [Rhodococcus sp. BUPNP1]TWH09139.1 Response regulator containing a CheY-like receiver domain and an HTH DNA-binding domain [Rhodococcus rhodochrous J45]BDB61457.1 helix-turn-helix transcriptional regulator [Rhodococcus sp. RDE2]